MPRVKDSNRSPYSAVGQLMMHFTDGNWYSGSGALISNRQVLTCARNLIDRQGYRADQVRFYAGWNQMDVPIVTGAAQTPYIRAQCAFYGDGYQHGEDTWDIGLIHLAVPVQLSYPHTYFTMQTVNDTELVAMQLSLLGYPENHPGEMWADRDEVEAISLEENSLFHLHETSADSSGSPMYEYFASDESLHLYAVHVQAPDMLRRAALLTPAIRQRLAIAQAHIAHDGPFVLHMM